MDTYSWLLVVTAFSLGLLFLKWFLAVAGDFLQMVYWRMLNPAQKERYLQRKLERAEGVREYKLNQEKSWRNKNRF